MPHSLILYVHKRPTPLSTFQVSLSFVPHYFHPSSNSYKPLLKHSHYQQVTMEVGGNEFTEITLRPLDLSDIDAFMVWATDDKVARFCRWDAYTSKADALDFIKNKVIPHPWFRAICLNGQPIGTISVTRNIGNDECRGELGYALGYKYWGKGIATKAVKLVANTIFSEWPHLERLEARVLVENVGSQRVLEKAGFQREGVLRKYMTLKGKTRDLTMFSLLSADPQS